MDSDPYFIVGKSIKLLLILLAPISSHTINLLLCWSTICTTWPTTPGLVPHLGHTLSLIHMVMLYRLPQGKQKVGATLSSPNWRLSTVPFPMLLLVENVCFWRSLRSASILLENYALYLDVNKKLLCAGSVHISRADRSVVNPAYNLCAGNKSTFY